MILLILRRGDALFFFEHLAEVGRGIESALDGHLGHTDVAAFDQTAGLFDFNGIQVGNQRNA